MRTPYPLQWPADWERTPDVRRQRATFSVGLAVALDSVCHELHLMGAVNATITSDLPTRSDGLPYASGRANDPGIAVYFELDGVERVLACDQWTSPAANVRAIALTFGALRGMQRWGATGGATRALQGFTALPPGPTS